MFYIIILCIVSSFNIALFGMVNIIYIIIFYTYFLV